MWRGLAISGVLLASTGCFVHVRQGSGNAVNESREVGAFTGVISDHPFDVEIVPGDTDQVSVFCDDNLLDTVITRVEHDDLTIRKVRSDGPFVQIDPTVTCLVSVVVADLQRAAATGSGHVSVASEAGFPSLEMVVSSGSGGVDVLGPITVPSFEASTSGSGSIDLQSVNAGSVMLVSSGSGGLEVEGGTTDILDIRASGSGGVDTRGLVAAEADVDASGSGSVELTATAAIEADLSGSGSVRIWGDPPQRDVDATGSGQVSFISQ